MRRANLRGIFYAEIPKFKGYSTILPMENLWILHRSIQHAFALQIFEIISSRKTQRKRKQRGSSLKCWSHQVTFAPFYVDIRTCTIALIVLSFYTEEGWEWQVQFVLELTSWLFLEFLAFAFSWAVAGRQSGRARGNRSPYLSYVLYSEIHCIVSACSVKVNISSKGRNDILADRKVSLQNRMHVAPAGYSHVL